MAWLRIDDGFPENRKILALPRRDRWTWLEVLAYCARQQNGGQVPNGISDIVRHATPAFIEAAHKAGLLDVTGTGYEVHHWDEYNPKDPTNAVRQQRYRNAKRNAEVTENVTEENVTTVTPPRARVPSRPQPLKEPTNQTTSTTDEVGLVGSENGFQTINYETILKDIP
jgi:hypothetical protein